jgi:hypothetical protein
MAVNYGTAVQNEVLMLETINRDIDLLENVETGLDKRFSDMGKETEASLRSFRVPLQTEMGGAFGAFNSDGGAYPVGLGPSYDQGQMTPVEIIVATTFTELARRIGESGQNVSVVNPVDRAIGDMQKKMAKKRNMLLQTSNTGQIATVAATYAGGGANPVQLATTSFGGRLIDPHDTIQVMDANYNLRGTAFVQDKISASVGGIDTLTLDQVPANTQAGDNIMVQNVAAGTPLFFQGLQYIINPSSAGEYLGMNRALSYTQSPAFNANGSPLTLGAVQAFLVRMQQARGVETFMSEATKNFWYGHPAQWFQWEANGFAIQMNVLSDGKASSFDGVPSPKARKEIAGFEFVPDSVAAIDKLYFIDQAVLVRCRFHKGPQMLPGPLNGLYWPRVSGSTHLTQNDVYFYDAVNYASRNPWASGVIYALAVPGALSN